MRAPLPRPVIPLATLPKVDPAPMHLSARDEPTHRVEITPSIVDQPAKEARRPRDMSTDKKSTMSSKNEDEEYEYYDEEGDNDEVDDL